MTEQYSSETVTFYEADVSHWEDWQQGYRFGALAVFPPDPLREQVNALRATHDHRAQSICDAHISLTIPFPLLLSSADWSELQSIASALEPFSIRYGPLRNYLPHPGVCLSIEPQDELNRLRVALEAASCFVGAPPRPHPFSAHMTIAEFLSVEQTKALMDELRDVAPNGMFTCDGLSYAVPDRNFHFTERKRLELGH